MSAARPQHTSIQCLAAVAQHHGVQVNPERIIHDYALGDEEPKPALLLRMAAEMGLKAKLAKLTWEELVGQKGVFPVLARRSDGRSIIVVGVQGEAVAVLDPALNSAAVGLLDRKKFCDEWLGDVVFLKRHYSLTDPNQPFGLRWFIPEILRQKVAFRDIAIAAMSLHFLGLASPIFFQLVIDKVLVHQSSSTLWVLSVGVVLALLFESVFGFLRQYLMLAATNKIDMRLTRRTFGHLLSLPIDYFDTTTVGVVARNVLQLDRVRQFLTGRLFFMVLDTTSLLVFLPMLFVYSYKLAMITLGFTLVISSIVAALVPTYRRLLNDLNTAEGSRQAMLVESIHGMRTIKALAIEPKQRRVWDQRSAEAITAHFKVGQLALSAGSVTGFLEKLLPITIIVIGAQTVFDGDLTVGALIAFQMLSGRVMGPISQIVGLINEYQEVALSVGLLGDVMNRSPEGRAGTPGLRPKLSGGISFEDVTFRYPGSTVPALDRARINIPAGAVIGIVGRSGSGKTTLTKLIQGLYAVQEGIIRFDGVDAREIDLAHLRRQIGVVLQENFLFRGTVRENVAAAKSDSPFEEVVAACQAAGADEFIERLPHGYDSLLEENGANLSGGQKQRLSIARALLLKPRILILDEAASALDPETEAIFIRHLSRIAVGRTVIMISHRLSTLVNSHAILVMQQGRVVDAGRHGDLLARCATYQQLWNQQTGHL
ncbi:MAG: peptidase domain-containing ABC transporter [Methylococcaceae bacterium]|nr:peptidase domain-containing ABC transporter [Methylococcaceae bacterium]